MIQPHKNLVFDERVLKYAAITTDGKGVILTFSMGEEVFRDQITFDTKEEAEELIKKIKEMTDKEAKFTQE